MTGNPTQGGHERRAGAGEHWIDCPGCRKEVRAAHLERHMLFCPQAHRFHRALRQAGSMSFSEHDQKFPRTKPGIGCLAAVGVAVFLPVAMALGALLSA
jgi:hypothetical protein